MAVLISKPLYLAGKVNLSENTNTDSSKLTEREFQLIFHDIEPSWGRTRSGICILALRNQITRSPKTTTTFCSTPDCRCRRRWSRNKRSRSGGNNVEILQVALSNKITQNMGPTQIHKKSFLFKKKKNIRKGGPWSDPKKNTKLYNTKRQRGW